ncbi:MAG: HAD family hydrolase [Gomphosphaeria aponina SAG 52.96 = DSM 107014]|uniref:HAD family hydrolase n=1 Tax=Gomphosphaeria aponina SAG 52.96 = DSM 107014 TaxID=1521640 RepID=A0A941JSY5_9CHRO|nr:HAD family hydrolase [Gomphosphaeria aponina SAG 52.96 = DSM 107014]
MVTISCGGKFFPNIQAVIFDKDGTLEDSQNFERELGIKRARMIDAQIPGIGEPLLMAFGIEDNNIDPAGLMAVGSRWENEIAAAAYIAETGRSWFEAQKIAKKAFAEADKYLEKSVDNCPLFAGGLEVIKMLSEAGVKLGILSADTTDGVKEFVGRHQLGEYFQLTMGGDRGISKPDPALFLQACAALGVLPAETLMVGDSQGDLEMARGAGAAGVIGICQGKAAKHLKEADVACDRLDEIKIVHSDDLSGRTKLITAGSGGF